MKESINQFINQTCIIKYLIQKQMKGNKGIDLKMSAKCKFRLRREKKEREGKIKREVKRSEEKRREEKIRWTEIK